MQQTFPSLSVVGSGYSWLQEFAFQAGAANVEEGRVTFVGIGRGALTQPDFARRLEQGLPLDRKRICRTFSFCTALMRSKHNDLGQFATGCPPFDKEVYGPIWEEAKARRGRGLSRRLARTMVEVEVVEGQRWCRSVVGPGDIKAGSQDLAGQFAALEA